uniref:Uncharacterized protein n=1 Tax=Peronospora matthiolae TaxID=2874970 RepID=A0AAV1U5L7_9STRA
MRIYTTELLAAVAFIESLSRYSVSGSKTLRPDLHSSDHPKDRVGDASDDGMSQSDDEANGEDRTGTQDVHSLLAVVERAQKRTYDHEIPDFDAQGWDRFVLGQAEDQVHDQIIPTLAAQDRDHVALGRAEELMHVHDIPSGGAQGWDRLRHAHDAPERLESSGTVATPVLDLPSLAEKEQAPVVASRSEADSTRVNEHSPGVASRLEADSTRINEEPIAKATQSEVKRKRAIEHALAVASQPIDKRTSIIEQLQQKTDENLLSADEWNSLKEKKTQDWTAEQLMHELVEVYCAKADGLTKLASALLKAKVASRNDGEIFTALEAAMLEAWKNRGITFDQSSDLLNFSNLKEEKDMTDRLRLLERYKFVSHNGRRGPVRNVYLHLLGKLESKDNDKYLRTIAQMGEESTIAKGMLMYYLGRRCFKGLTYASMIERMCAAEISESMIQRLPNEAHKFAQAQEKNDRKVRWEKIAEGLETALKEDPNKVVNKALVESKSSSNPSANNSKRKEGAFPTYEAALASPKEDPKRRKTAGPSIRR